MSDSSNDELQHVAKRSRTSSTMSDEGAATGAAAMADVRVDESLESRSMLVYGVESMKKMKRANVFLSGLSGLGVEIGAKYNCNVF